MERFSIYDMPPGMIVPYTYSFPLIRQSGLPKEFRGPQMRKELTGSIYPLDFEYFLPPYR